MMYNISVAEKRVLNKEKQFLEVLYIAWDNKVLSILSFPLFMQWPSEYLVRGLWKGGPDIDIGNYQNRTELKMLSHIKVNLLGW